MNELGGYAFADLQVGMCTTFAKTITEADIVLFAAVSGDNNAIHINDEFAAGTIFKGMCVPKTLFELMTWGPPQDLVPDQKWAQGRR